MSSVGSSLEVEGSEACSDQSSRSPTPFEDEEPRKRLKPPDSKRFEREIEKLNSHIREKEAKLQSLQRPASRSRSASNSSNHAWKDRETLLGELRGLKAEKDKDIEKRKKIDLELRGLTTLVQQKNDACGKAQAGLKYKNEAKTDEKIRRLEHQLRVQQLKLRDEKRIVTDIDALRRSKKLIHEFVALKQVLDELRDKQRALRTQRDTCTKRINGLKSKEDEIKNILDEQKSKSDGARSLYKETESERMVLKREIDELYRSKRELVASFNKERNEYFNNMREVKMQLRQKRKEEANRLADEKQIEHIKERRTRAPPSQPYKAELALCSTLIEYMERLTLSHQTDRQPSSSSGETTPSPEPLQRDAVANVNSSDGMFLKRKTDEDLVGVYAGGRKMSRRGSRKNRKSLGKETLKKLILHQHVVEQFMSIHVVPPSTSADIPKVVCELQAKTEFYTATAATVAAAEPLSGAASVESSTPSSIAEDFPSLPSLPSSESPDLQQSEDMNSSPNESKENGTGTQTVEEDSEAVENDQEELHKVTEERTAVKSEVSMDQSDIQSDINTSDNSSSVLEKPDLCLPISDDVNYETKDTNGHLFNDDTKEQSGIVSSNNHRSSEPVNQTGISVVQNATSVNQKETSVNHTETAVNHTETAVNQTEAVVNQNETSVNHTETAVNQNEASVNHAETAVNQTEAAVNQNRTSVNQTVTPANQNEMNGKVHSKLGSSTKTWTEGKHDGRNYSSKDEPRNTREDSDILFNERNESDLKLNSGVTKSTDSTKFILQDNDDHVTVYNKSAIDSTADILTELNEDRIPASMTHCEKCPA